MGIAYNTSIVRDGLVLHLDAANPKSYTGSGTVWKDLSGLGNNGTLVNNASLSDGNLVLDGVDDHVFVGTGASYTSVANITLEAFIFSQRDSSYEYIFSCDRDCCGVYNGYSIKKLSNGLQLMLWNTANYDGVDWRTSVDYINAITTVNFNTWYHVAATYDGATAKIYKNGVLAGSKSTTKGIGYPSSFPLRIGAMGYTQQYEFQGSISSPRIYNRALTAAEIKQNFEALRGRYGI